jgi:hypothetical protein
MVNVSLYDKHASLFFKSGNELTGFYEIG